MKIKNLSVSQYNNFECNRKWFLASIEKVKQPTTPAQLRGSNIHKAIECRIEGVPQPAFPEPDMGIDYSQFVNAVADHLPRPGEEFYVEHKLSLPTILGVPWIGFIDLWRWDIAPQKLIDWKSTSDLRYAKNHQELRTDIQLNTYAHYAFQMIDTVGGKVDTIEAGLVYVEAAMRKGKLPKNPKVKPVFIDIHRDQALRMWESTFPQVEKMARTSEALCAEDVEPNTQICPKFGGCPYRTRCGISPMAGIGGPFHTPPKKKKELAMGFLDKLKNGNGSSTKGTTQIAAPKTEEPQITPPDAPPRNIAATVADLGQEEVLEAAPKKRGRPKKAKTVAEAVEAAPEAVETDKTVKVTKPKNGSIIYVDCLPVKGGDDVTTIEDWFGPICMQLNEWAMTEKNLPDYRLTGFSEEKAALALAVQSHVAKNGLPPTLLVSSGGISRDLLALLVPHATQVVRALRG